MGWNYRKSIKIAPGVKVNISKRGVGMSAGTKGFRVGVNSKGKTYASASVPGTGIYYRKEYGSNSQSPSKNAKTKTSIMIWVIIATLLAGIGLAVCDHLLLGVIFILVGIVLIVLKLCL